MKTTWAVLLLLMLPHFAHAAPAIYTDQALFLADLSSLQGSTVYESFEDDAVWADSRTSIPAPGSAASVTSQGIVWTSNFPQNERGRLAR